MLHARVLRVARESCAVNHTHHVRLRDKDAQKLITLWKFESIYIYSTPSIPTTETTHGISQEDVEKAQQEAAQGGEEASEAQSEKARQEARQETR